MSDAVHATLPIALTTAGIWKVCIPSDAEYIGLNEIASEQPTPLPFGVLPSGDDPGGWLFDEGELEEQAAAPAPPAPSAKQIPTAA
jgi:hypothetical protein